LTNAADGVIDLQGDNANLGTAFGATGSVVNSGVLKRSSGSGTDTIAVPITNQATGTIRNDAGTLAVSSTLTDQGTINLSTGAMSISGAFTPASTATLGVTVGPTGNGSLTVGGATKLAGRFAITTTPGYTPPLGTVATILQTTGTQTGGFGALRGQLIATTNDAWRVSTTAKKVTITVAPAADVAATITAPTTATVNVAFTATLTVTNNGPSVATAASVSMTLPAGVTISGTLPTGCTQPTTTTLRCSAGSLAVGASKSFTVSFVSSTTGTKALRAVARTSAVDAVTANNRQTASVIVS
jgi:hypothetical protein